MDAGAMLAVAGEVCFLGMVAAAVVLARRQDHALGQWAFTRAVAQEHSRNETRRKREQAEAVEADSTGEPVPA